MMAMHMAPGMNREFLAESWNHTIPRKLWYETLEEAQDLITEPEKTDIQGYDQDGNIVAAARQNAKAAGVDHLIHFQQRPVSQLNHPKKYGFLISNPPYGERLEERKALPALYKEIGEAMERLEDWSVYLITAYDQAEKDIGKKAARNRKIYNGMLKTYFYQFPGAKPPRNGGGK
jgi:putative N6-adenine-specific DNA methylase